MFSKTLFFRVVKIRDCVVKRKKKETDNSDHLKGLQDMHFSNPCNLVDINGQNSAWKYKNI